MNMPEYQRISLKPMVLLTRSSLFKDIPDSPDGVDHFLGKVLVHLIAQPADQHVYDIRLRVEAVTPHVLQNHGLGNHSPGISHEVFQEGKFAGLQVKLLTRTD